MATAVIVDAVRTPLGRRNGKLKDTHPVDLAAHVLKAIVDHVEARVNPESAVAKRLAAAKGRAA